MNMLAYPLFIGTWELVLIIVIIVLLFGAKKIPELMKGVGKGVKSFKQGLNEIDEQVNLSDGAKSEPKEDEKSAGD